MRALIVGAGIAGLSTALAFERVGIDATVVERAPAPRAEGSALTLSFNALAAAEALRSGGSIVRHAMQIDEVRVADLNDRTIDVIRLVASDGSQLSSYAVRRADLLAALGAARRGAVEYGCTVETVSSGRGVVDVAFRAAGRHRYELVVAADGALSRLRRQLFPGSEAVVARDRCWRFVAPDHRSRREVVEYLGPSRRLGLIPLSDDEVSVFATVRAGRSVTSLDSSSAARLFADFPAPAAELVATHAADRPEPLVWLPWPLLARDRVALVGDAAHVMTPNLAQGAALAMEDAVVLAACLTDARHVPDALADYARRRRPRLLAISAASLAAGSIAHIAHPWVRSARDRFLEESAMTGPLLRRLLDWTPDLVTTAVKSR